MKNKYSEYELNEIRYILKLRQEKKTWEQITRHLGYYCSNDCTRKRVKRFLDKGGFDKYDRI
ncbi:hypothetical protein AN641_03685 [Candidatus Epulonipiscioides gigas]|nr:hypothetical protein AN641_03685 [Epulopiscium sp. SCG-C07WGA-EpuloA2]